MKHLLRKQIRAELARHDADELQQMSRRICQAVLANDVVCAADVILAFWPMANEPDIRPAIRQLYAHGKTILLPRVISKTEMEFCPYEGDASLRAVPPYGIFEPTTPAVPAVDTAVMLVPGVAFDDSGNRLGHGAGYYDRYLALSGVNTIGVCFPFQIVAEVPTDIHDVKVNTVVADIS